MTEFDFDPDRFLIVDINSSEGLTAAAKWLFGDDDRERR
jgi:hypothetical protein